MISIDRMSDASDDVTPMTTIKVAMALPDVRSMSRMYAPEVEHGEQKSSTKTAAAAMSLKNKNKYANNLFYSLIPNIITERTRGLVSFLKLLAVKITIITNTDGQLY